MKKKALLSSILTIVLCISIIAGSTFALFTSDDSVNIAVTAGKVEMTATIADNTLELYSIGDYQGEGITVFENGGTAAISAAKDALTLERVTPGDEVKFEIEMRNDSNVHILYRVQYDVVDAHGNKLYAFGDTIWKEWMTPASEEARVRTTPVSVLFDVIAGNEYQEDSMSVTFTVEAIQANADVYDTLLSNSAAANLQQKFITPEGGVIDGNGMTVTISEDDGGVGLVHNNKVTLQNIVLNAEEGAIAAIYGNCCGKLELGADTVINASAGSYGIFYLFNNNSLVLGEGSVINASGDGAACIRIDAPSGEVDIYFGGSDLLNPINNAMGIFVTCGGGTFNIYVESTADYEQYKTMIVEDPHYVGTNTYNWYINGNLVTQ